jgi:hypothetical protein
MYRSPDAAPASAVAENRRGATLGRFCRGCGGIYPLYREQHTGKALNGRDHVAPPCAHEGERFDDGDPWWEDAVKILPAAG